MPSMMHTVYIMKVEGHRHTEHQTRSLTSCHRSTTHSMSPQGYPLAFQTKCHARLQYFQLSTALLSLELLLVDASDWVMAESLAF